MMFRDTDRAEPGSSKSNTKYWITLMAAGVLTLSACGDDKESQPLDREPTTEATESTVGVVIDDPPPEEESPNVVDPEKVEEFHATSTTATTTE